jgi:pyruvate formate lyase activating enzyme
MATEQDLMWWKEKCIVCGDCQDACTKGAVSLLDDYLLLDQTKCDLCGACVDACNSQALKLVGKEMTVTQVVEEIEKDLVFYDQSGGGVTFSGGEPLMQPHFLHDLLKTCKNLGIHTAVDTCGYVKQEIILKISKQVDLFLYDLKMINDEKHIKFTGLSNKLILENLKELSERRQKIVVRFPLIPDVNDDEKDILELGSFVSSLELVKEISILPYHRAGFEKLKRMKKPTDLSFVSHPPSAEMLSEIEERLKDFGLKIRIGG